MSTSAAGRAGLGMDQDGSTVAAVQDSIGRAGTMQRAGLVLCVQEVEQLLAILLALAVGGGLFHFELELLAGDHAAPFLIGLVLLVLRERLPTATRQAGRSQTQRLVCGVWNARRRTPR